MAPVKNPRPSGQLNIMMRTLSIFDREFNIFPLTSKQWQLRVREPLGASHFVRQRVFHLNCIDRMHFASTAHWQQH